MPGRAGGLEARQQAPDLVRADDRVDGDHAVVRERDDRRRFEGGQERLELAQAAGGRVHHQVLATARGDDGAEHRVDRGEVVARARGRRSGWRRGSASESRTSPIWRRPFITSVEPVETRSTMPSARPSRGATSTAPEIGMISTAMPAPVEEAARRVRVGGGDAQAGQVLDGLVRRVVRDGGGEPAAAVAERRGRAAARRRSRSAGRCR